MTIGHSFIETRTVNDVAEPAPITYKSKSTRYTLLLLAALAVDGFSVANAQTEDPPSLTDIKCFDIVTRSSEWAITMHDIEIVLEGVTGKPLWIDIDEDPAFSSPTTLDFYDQRPMRVIRTFESPENSATAVAYSPDGTQVLTGGNNLARLWNAQTGQEIRTFAGHNDGNYDVAFSPDGSQVLTGGGDNTAKLWNTQTGEEIRTFVGHTSVVASVAFNSDGSQILTGSSDDTARLWNALTGEEIRAFSGHNGHVRSVAFSPDGLQILTGGDDNTAKLWNALTGEEIRTFAGHEHYVMGVAFSPDGTQVLTGSVDTTAKLWNTQTGEEIHTLAGHYDGIYSVAFSPDGTKVLTGSDTNDRKAKLWDVQTGEEIRTTDYHGCIITSVAFSPDGTQLLTGCCDKIARLWDTSDRFTYWLDYGLDGPRTVYVRLRNHAGPSEAVSYTINLDLTMPGKPGTPEAPHGNWSFDPVTFIWSAASDAMSGVASYDCQIGTAEGESDVYDANVGNVLSTTVPAQIEQTLYCRARAIDLAGNEGRWSDWSSGVFVGDANAPKLTSMTLFNANGAAEDWTDTQELTLTLNDVQHIPLWVDIDENPAFDSPTTLDYADQIPASPIRTFTDESFAWSVIFSADGSHLLTSGADDTAKLWNLQTGEKIRTFDGHDRGVNSAAFSPDGLKLLTGSDDHTAKLWNVQTGEEIRTFTGHTDDINSVSFSPDGTQILTGSRDQSAKLWNAQTGEVIHNLWGHVYDVNSVAFSPDSSLALTGGHTKAKLWDTQTGAEIRTFSGHGNYVMAVTFSPDGSQILTGSLDDTAKLWNVQTGEEIRTFSGHNDDVLSVAFSPDGSQILTGSGDYTAKLWDVQSGVEIRTFTGHGNEVVAVAFSPDRSQVLTSGGRDYTCKLWSVRPQFIYTLGGGDEGTRTVYVRLRNHAGQSAVVSDSIILNNSNGVSDWMLYR